LLILLPSLVTQFISIFLMLRCPARSTLFPYTTLFRSNWVSGLSSLDHQRIPGLNAYEQSFDAYSGSQHYFFIPLVFGLLGGLFQWKRNPRDLFVVACLFFFTGLAIVLYLNQTPMQPRERDYAYAGSFYVFAI